MLKVIALDLEGTLISNAMSQITRPDLFEFLEKCKSICDRIVIYTAVSEERFRNIANLLVAEKTVPSWFSDIEYIEWDRVTKNLLFIPNIQSIEDAVLIDDYQAYVHPGQESRWIEIKQFEHPYLDTDKELKSVLIDLIKYIKT